MATSSRAIYSIDAELLRRFNAVFAQRERSKVIEKMIQKVLAKREQGLLEAARKIESDPRLASIREVSDDMDRIAGGGSTGRRGVPLARE